MSGLSYLMIILMYETFLLLQNCQSKKEKRQGDITVPETSIFFAVHPKLWQLKCAFSSSTRRVVCSEEHRTKESRLQYWGLEDRENSAHSQWQLALQTAVYSYSIIT